MEEKEKDTPIEFSANAGPTRTYSVYTGEALPSSLPQDSDSSICEE